MILVIGDLTELFGICVVFVTSAAVLGVIGGLVVFLVPSRSW